ncbi:TIGR03620 family F420-dependent LLM class oxidoreductase [Lentzea alba]|uniref:TIGR03620 family F420-dependent LLM class oxidoreductase n=1 Tax=Lentzea alba TaxID=2714351 RepID=UPI0039BFCD92
MLGTFGVWGPKHAWSERAGEVAELEALGYSTFWYAASPEADLAVPEQMLAATTTMTIATGVLNVWETDPETVTASYRRIGSDRLVLGVGAGHKLYNAEYERPLERVSAYLDGLDVPQDRLMLAALRPKMLELAARRTAGAHPYLNTPEHTAEARQALGDRLLAPAVCVVVEEDREAARRMAREFTLVHHTPLANYRNSWKRYGFTDDDFAGAGSDRLVDAVVPMGNPDQVAQRLRAHLEAGADHVAIQSLNGRYDELAAALAP